MDSTSLANVTALLPSVRACHVVGVVRVISSRGWCARSIESLRASTPRRRRFPGPRGAHGAFVASNVGLGRGRAPGAFSGLSIGARLCSKLKISLPGK